MLIVLHNFEKVYNDETMEVRIKDDIYGCFNVDKFPFPAIIMEAGCFSNSFKEINNKSDL